jgi:DNA-binding MarR family transcriptional regulator
MNHEQPVDWRHLEPPRHLGQLLNQLADDFQQRTLSKCRARGHRKFRGSHGAVIDHLDPVGLSLGDLAGRIGISQQATGKLVRDLERAGYLESQLDNRDKRSRIIRLSSSGSGLKRDMAEVLNEVRGEYAAVLGDSGIRALEQHLRDAASALGPEFTLPLAE